MFLDDLDEEDYEIAIKVVIVGNGAVGKSSMIQRYCKGIFTRNYKKTIGVDFLEKHITASGEDVRLMLWDTAGQEEFDAITKAYYRGAQACVIAFSTVDKCSFDAVKKWKRKVEDECGHIPMVLVQNKIDLLHESQVDNYEIEKFARNTGLKLFRTSVKENLNVAKVFHHLAERHIESVSRWSDESAEQMEPCFQIGMHAGQAGNGFGFGPQQRDTRVRFSSSTENLESGGSGGSGSSNNSLSYFHTRLFPMNHRTNNGGLSTKKLNRANKQRQKQQQQQQQQQQHFQHFYAAPFAFPVDNSSSDSKTIVLNPFRRAKRQQQQQQLQQLSFHQQQQLRHHQLFAPRVHQAFPPVQQQQQKPACRVL